MPQRIINYIEYYVEGRLFEWVIGLSMLGLAYEIHLHPDALRFSTFKQIAEVMSTPFIGYFMAVVGTARIVGLIYNGHWVQTQRTGPMIRSIVAVVCAWMWAMFAWSLMSIAWEEGRTYPSLPFWIMFTVGEIYVAYKAALNARRI